MASSGKHEMRRRGRGAGVSRAGMTSRQVTLDELRVGMYIHDLNCKWRDHPFSRNRFLITDTQVLARVQALSVPYVVIDASKGWNLDAAGAERSGTPDVVATGAADEDSPASPTPFALERPVAVRIRQQAMRLVAQAMQQARFGHAPEPEPLRTVADDIVASLLRNRNALLSVQQLRSKDRYTFEHSVSVAVLATAFGLYLGLQRAALQRLAIAGLLHDVGKTVVPDMILLKCGQLTDAELKRMRGHVEHTRTILASMPGLHGESVRGAAEHHERHDGSGYPHGLKGDEISPFGRIVGICDVYDALTVDRCYRPGRTPGKALRWLLERAGRDFEATLVHRFIRCIGIYPAGSLVALRSGRLGVVIEHNGDGRLLLPKVRAFFDTRARRHISPVDVDLANDTDDAVLRHEDPTHWGATIDHYLG